MALNKIGSFTSKRDLATLGIFACLYAVLFLLHAHAWVILAVSALFVGYHSRATTAFLVRQQSFSGKSITAWALPVGMAGFKVLSCLGVVWLVVWLVRR